MIPKNNSLVGASCSFFKREFVWRNQFSTVSHHPSFPKKIFSGIQPTGSLHLGNYLGAVTQWKKFQDNDEDVTVMIADLHSITLPHNPQELSLNLFEMTATLMACGINPDKVTLFQQSKVPQHTELCWCLGCIATMPRLAHLPAFKEKSAMLKDVPLGLYIYPILQAADILAHKSTHVPVGADQNQHIELTQELARMFNNRFGNTFPIPHSIITGKEHARLKSLRDPSKKMSKSDPDPKSRICLLDTPDDIVKKIKKAVTDFTSEVTYDPDNRPGVSNLISIHSFVENKSVEEICKQAESLSTGKYKMVVADAVINHIKPIQENIYHLLDNKKYLLDILSQGDRKATELSSITLQEVKQKLGMRIEMGIVDEIKVKL